MDKAAQIGMMLEEGEISSLFDEYANSKSVSYFGFKKLCEGRKLITPTFNQFIQLLENSDVGFSEAEGPNGQQVWIAIPDGAQVNIGSGRNQGMGNGIQQCQNCGSATEGGCCSDCGYTAESAGQPNDSDMPMGGMGDVDDMSDAGGMDGIDNMGAGDLGMDGQAFGPELDDQSAPGVSTLGDDNPDDDIQNDNDIEGYDEMRAESIDNTLLQLINENFKGKAQVVNYKRNGLLIPAIETKNQIIYFASNGIITRKR